MKTVLKVLFILFLVWMVVGIYLLNINHSKAQVVMGLGVLYMSFVLMPIFIYHRYKGGKYKKYIIENNNKKKAKD